MFCFGSTQGKFKEAVGPIGCKSYVRVKLKHHITGRNPRARFICMGNYFNLPVTSVGVIEMFMKAGGREMAIKQKNVELCASA